MAKKGVPDSIQEEVLLLLASWSLCLISSPLSSLKTENQGEAS